MISAVRKVVVPVDDQEQAVAFWTTRMGFTVTRDETDGRERWIEVAAPAAGPVLVLSPRRQPFPEVPAMLPHSPLFFSCEDIEQTYQELSGRGVEFPAPPVEMPFGWWSMFCDQDGTRYALGQWG